MGDKTGIEWTDATWNPFTGCTKVSQGCKNCYAERVATKYGGSKGFKFTIWHDRFKIPGRWDKARKIFVCSMSDLFQEAAHDTDIDQVFEAMGAGPQHTYQVLTKRIERAVEWGESRPNYLSWPQNVWLGTSIEDMETARERIPHLLNSKAKIKFLSIEPLLGPVSIAHWIPGGIDWVIVGGESGDQARLMEANWVRIIRDECRAANVPFFFKQWGGIRSKDGGRLLDGKTWDQMP